MDKQELAKLLAELDNQLQSSCDVILIGGAAMILHYGSRRATHDIDILLVRGNAADLRQAIRAVASQHGLPENWINEAAKGFADILPRDFYHRLIPLDLAYRYLRLYVVGRPEQVAMKIVALREQDMEDLELLFPSMSETDKQVLLDIMQHVATFRVDWAQRIRYFLLEQGWEIE